MCVKNRKSGFFYTCFFDFFSIFDQFSTSKFQNVSQDQKFNKMAYST